MASVMQDKVTSLFGFGSSAQLEVVLDATPRNKFWKVKDANKNVVKLPIYTADDDISGTVTVKLESGKKFEHLGIRVELIGHLGTNRPYLEIFNDKSLSTDFMAMAKELEPAGTLTDNKSFTFRFAKFEKQYESFNGIAGQVRYFVRTSVNRNYSTKIVKEIDFAVQLPNPELENEGQVPIKMEVGIEDCLHIEF